MKNAAKSKKLALEISALAVLIAVAGFLVWIYGNPFKITNPADPRFNPSSFNFADYSQAELQDAFRVLFPVGTSKTFVDAILVQAGGALQARDKTFKSLVTYWEPWRFHWKNPPHYNFTFDDQGRLLNIRMAYRDLYPEQRNYQTLFELQKGADTSNHTDKRGQ